MQVERKLEFYTPIMLLLMTCFFMLFSFYANKVEASEVATLTVNQDIMMKVHGVEIKNELVEKTLRLVDVDDSTIFFTKASGKNSFSGVFDGTYHVYDLTKQGDGAAVNHSAHNGLTPVGQVTVENGKLKGNPVVLNYNDSTLYLVNPDIQLQVTSTETGAIITGERGRKLWFKDANSQAQATKMVGQDSTVTLGEATYLIYDTTRLIAGFTPGESDLIGVVKVTQTPPPPTLIHVTITVPWN